MILGIETATQVCGVALCHEGRLVAEYRLNMKNVHAGLLISSVDKILADSRFKPADLDAIAVSIGPGSFTGLRIGLATAKGLAFANNQAIVGVPTLAALAGQAPLRSGVIAALLRSRVREYYAALYERNDFVDRALQPAQVISESDLARFVPPQALVVADPACHLHAGAYATAPISFAYPSAFTVARLGETLWQQGEFKSADILEPDYLQDFITGQPKAGLQ